MPAIVKTTGGKGLHVVVPMRPESNWNTIKDFAKAVSDIVARTFPDRFTTNVAKTSRRGKIFLDCLRNLAGATAIAAYSPRNRQNAPVSMPISWDELGAEDMRFDYFNIRNATARLKRLKRDPWSGYDEVQQSITRDLLRTVGVKT
jgi:bifunctional non-homologous end joining protein LigD